MVDTVFRKATEPQGEVVVEKIEKSEPVVVHEESKKQLSPELWSNTNGKPYLTKILGLENVYNDLAPEVSSDIDFIEEYFKEMVRAGKRGNDNTSYKEFMSYFEKITNSQNQPIISKLNKIADFIKTIKRAKEYGANQKT